MKSTQFIDDIRDSVEQIYKEGKLMLGEKTSLRLSLINPISTVQMDNDTYRRTKGKVTGEKII
jgi:hypothetical protein